MLDGRMGMQLSASLREESDPPSSVTVMITPEFQSTLPRRERLFGFNRTLDRPRISIHAPAKGATSFRIRIAIFRDYFNPRSREGSDSKNHQDYPR